MNEPQSTYLVARSLSAPHMPLFLYVVLKILNNLCYGFPMLGEPSAPMPRSLLCGVFHYIRVIFICRPSLPASQTVSSLNKIIASYFAKSLPTYTWGQSLRRPAGIHVNQISAARSLIRIKIFSIWMVTSGVEPSATLSVSPMIALQWGRAFRRPICLYSGVSQ